MSEYAIAGIESRPVLIILVECGACRHIDSRRVVVAVIGGCCAKSASLPRTMSLKRVNLTCLWLEVEHFGSQESAMSRCVCTTYVLLLLRLCLGMLRAALVTVVATGALLLARAICLVCLRICIVVRGASLGECRRPSDARCSLRVHSAPHFLISARRVGLRQLLSVRKTKSTAFMSQ